jgi:hypothetical protein
MVLRPAFMPLRPKYIHKFVYMYTYILILLICMISKKTGLMIYKKPELRQALTALRP